MPLHRDKSSNPRSAGNGEGKRTFKLINAAISISLAVVMSALLLSFILTRMP